MSRAKRYREANRKTVIVDDFEWTIRKIPPVVLGKVMEITGVEVTGKMPTPKEAAKLGDKLRPKIFEIIEAVLPECVVDPKIATNPESEDELSISDLSTTTAFGLLDEIYKFSELTKEAFEKRRKFRSKPTRPAGGDTK